MSKKHKGEVAEPLVMSANDILSIQDREYRVVPVTKWKGRTVRLQSLNALEVIEYIASQHDDDPAKKTELQRTSTARLLTRTLVNEAGDLLYAQDDPAVVAVLMKKDSFAIREITEVAMEISGIHYIRADAKPDAPPAPSPLEEEKNDSAGTHTGSSDIDSPSTSVN